MITYDDKRSLSEYIYTSISQAVNETNIIRDNHYYYLILTYYHEKTKRNELFH